MGHVGTARPRRTHAASAGAAAAGATAGARRPSPSTESHHNTPAHKPSSRHGNPPAPAVPEPCAAGPHRSRDAAEPTRPARRRSGAQAELCLHHRCVLGGCSGCVHWMFYRASEKLRGPLSSWGPGSVGRGERALRPSRRPGGEHDIGVRWDTVMCVVRWRIGRDRTRSEAGCGA